ncbi:unnamed protein product [Caenorhabditis nigoni]
MLFLLQLLFIPIFSEYSMIEVYGIPQTFKSVNTESSFSWKQCIKFCWETPACVLAYNVKADQCQWFTHVNISTVKQTLKTNGYVVAFKINTTSTTCLSGTNPPTFNNKSITSSATLNTTSFTGPIRYNYTISFGNSLWTFSFTRKVACPGYHHFRQRGDGYCVVLVGAHFPNTANDAITNCTALYKDLLAGVASAAEMTAVRTMLLEYRSSFIYNDFVVRLDGKRTDTCQKTPTTATCMGVKGFTFTDPTLTTLAGYTWKTNSGAQPTANSNCIVLIVNGTNEIVADIDSCDTKTSLQPISYLCGTPAWTWV